LKRIKPLVKQLAATKPATAQAKRPRKVAFHLERYFAGLNLVEINQIK
jgi:hypothetical protein